MPQTDQAVSGRIQTWILVPTITVATLWLLQISPLSALITVIVMVVFTQFGRLLATAVGFDNVGFVVGFVIGAGALVFISQLLLITNIPQSVTHWLVTSGMLGTIFVISFTKSTRRLKLAIDGLSLPDETLLALSIGLLVLATRHPWLFPFAGAVAIFERWQSSRPTPSTIHWLMIAILPVGWLVASNFRPDRWWYLYQSNDSQFFESIGWSIAHWGVLEHPGYSGGSIVAYHWLSYAFLGSASHLSGMEPWDGLIKIGPLMLAFSFACVLLEGAHIYRRKITLAQWSTLLLAALVMPSTRFDSFAFSILVALVFLMLTKTYPNSADVRFQLPLFALLALTLIFAKTSTAVVIVFILMLHMAIQLWRREQVKWLPLGALIGTFGIVYVLLFRTSVLTETLKPADFQIEASLIELLSILEHSHYMIGFLLVVVTVILFWRRGQRVSSLNIAIATAAAAALPIHLYLATSTSGYFGLPGLYFLIFVAFQVWSRDAYVSSPGTIWRRAFVLLIVVLTGLGFGIGYRKILAEVDLRFEVAKLLGNYFWAIAKGSGYVIATAVFILWATRLRERKRISYASLMLTALLAISSGTGVDGYRRMLNYGVDNSTNWAGNSAPFPTLNLKNLGDYVRFNTDTDTVLASNNFCCFGSEWWEEITANLESDTQLTGESKWGGANYLLPAETRRRFLIQGLRFQTGYDLPTSEQMNRMTLSLDFANKPSASSWRRLKAYGVSGYVVNLSLTEHRDWSEFAIERFRSDNFVYLELR